MATKAPYVRVCNVFFYYKNFYVMALSTKQYDHYKEPPLEGYRITATVFIL